MKRAPFPVLPAQGLSRLGTRLAMARRARYLTQEDVALLAGVSASTVSSLESGYHGVSVGNLMKVLDALQLLAQIDDLLAPERDPMIVDYAVSRLER